MPLSLRTTSPDFLVLQKFFNYRLKTQKTYFEENSKLKKPNWMKIGILARSKKSLSKNASIATLKNVKRGKLLLKPSTKDLNHSEIY
jgi:hypothetical protein